MVRPIRLKRMVGLVKSLKDGPKTHADLLKDTHGTENTLRSDYFKLRDKGVLSLDIKGRTDKSNVLTLRKLTTYEELKALFPVIRRPVFLGTPSD